MHNKIEFWLASTSEDSSMLMLVLPIHQYMGHKYKPDPLTQQRQKQNHGPSCFYLGKHDKFIEYDKKNEYFIIMA